MRFPDHLAVLSVVSVQKLGQYHAFWDPIRGAYHRRPCPVTSVSDCTISATFRLDLRKEKRLP